MYKKTFTIKHDPEDVLQIVSLVSKFRKDILLLSKKTRILYPVKLCNKTGESGKRYNEETESMMSVVDSILLTLQDMLFIVNKYDEMSDERYLIINMRSEFECLYYGMITPDFNPVFEDRVDLLYKKFSDVFFCERIKGVMFFVLCRHFIHLDDRKDDRIQDFTDQVMNAHISDPLHVLEKGFNLQPA